ncbi:polysaccharide biosynthesis/export family protein [Alteraurantiacibacter aquimixticola]|uniref:Polysaccharide export protein n=1 Tax=Alteraurantiacibacter aquimixticola TaxID=2489173 RepID=A0A4T3EZI1_9SPHN|nr:polysaccharide biosynthesis/export family protein [Alteraurantiacibacter aquimixticola]TIX49289.1 polysaccharide export protein [Alteraurantiacibacter aquimixticola]
MCGATMACSSGPNIGPGRAVTEPLAALNQQHFSYEAPEYYALRPSDVIDVTVFREEELSATGLQIGPDGKVSLPLIGTMDAAGLTAVQFQEAVETALGARYLRDPSVAVNVASYASHLVTVEGSVGNPGLFPFQPGTRLSGGIALAGGPERVANVEQVAVFRQTPEGMEIAKFDYGAVREGTMLDPLLMPGDRIVVGRDGLSQLYLDLLQSLPIFAVFTRF